MRPGSEIQGFDFHCHVDLHHDPAGLITRCEQDGIVAIAVTTTPKAWLQNVEWTQNSPFVYAAVGLHPEVVKDRYTEIDLLEQRIGETRLVGEIGLDGSPQHKSSYEKQKEVFSRALAVCQRHKGRIATIHSRRAARDTIGLIERLTTPDDVLCILHWFSGSTAEVRRAASVGCYFSVNVAMLTSERGRELVRSIPEDRLLTESDSPFVAIGDHRNVAKYTARLMDDVAALRLKPAQELRSQIVRNSMRVLEFAGVDLSYMPMMVK